MAETHGRVKLLISYDGTDFSGWQVQTQAPRPTIQAQIEGALSQIFNQEVKVIGSGRTDAGVHAIGQIAHFDLPKPLREMDICYKLNRMTPNSIAVRRAWMAPEGFHAQLSAERKTYRYWVHNHRRPTALRCRYSAWIRYSLDLDYLSQLAKMIEGLHDFKSFQSVGTETVTTERMIYSATWRKRGSSLLFTITGDGFLKQMVRNLVGTMLEMNWKKRPVDDLLRILQEKDRKAALTTAPPEGLYLSRVYYPQELDRRCREL